MVTERYTRLVKRLAFTRRVPLACGVGGPAPRARVKTTRDRVGTGILD
jgi:hypothetical protein